MNNLQNIKNKMSEFISSLENDLAKQQFEALPHGKMLRSKLVLKIANASDEVINLCAIIELIHLASLLHDDVIDEANTRRGKQTLNALFGDKTAIMMGDILYSKAYFELSNFPKEVSRIISNAVCTLSIGELLDVYLSKSFNENENLYYEMIYKKTAILIEASAKAAAFMANKNMQNFANYGKNLGIAFQIVDDILDITQDEKTLGKPNLHDLKEGKTTLPYLYLYQSLNDIDKIKLKSFFAKNITKEQKDWILEKLKIHKCIEKSFQKANFHAQIALKSISNENIKSLEDIVNQMILRNF